MIKYLFFDLEFEQLYGGTLTTCEFGYVITNKNLDLLKTGKILINPNLSNFELQENGNRNYNLRSNINEYLCTLDFSYVFDEINDIFKQTNTSIGFAICNDANILNNDCKRYGLPYINQKLINVQHIYSYLHNNRHCPRLKDAVTTYGIKTKKFTFHDAQSDALATLFLLKAMLKNTNLTIRKLINRIPNLIIYSSYGFIENINKKQQNKIFNYLALKQKIETFPL